MRLSWSSSSAELTATLFCPIADKQGLLQPGICVCVGGTAVYGAGQQLRMRGAYVETAVATPLLHLTQLPLKQHTGLSLAVPHYLISITLLSLSVYILIICFFLL